MVHSSKLKWFRLFVGRVRVGDFVVLMLLLKLLSVALFMFFVEVEEDFRGKNSCEGGPPLAVIQTLCFGRYQSPDYGPYSWVQTTRKSLKDFVLGKWPQKYITFSVLEIAIILSSALTAASKIKLSFFRGRHSSWIKSISFYYPMSPSFECAETNFIFLVAF